VGEVTGGRALIAASALFWLSWVLMPGVGVTDAGQILERVALQRDAVWLSVVLQLVSAACFAPAVIGLGRLGRDARRPGITVGAVLLAIGAMGSAADAVFHLLAYHMTAPDIDAAAMVPIMRRMQGPGLAVLAPMLLAFFVGAATLAITCHRAGLVSARNPGLHAAAVVTALAAGAAVRADPALARPLGLIVLALVSLSLVGVGAALAPIVRRGRAAFIALAALVLTALATFVAGEAVEVVELRTQDASGARFDTEMWVVDYDGAQWVRVGNPERHWYLRLLAHPDVELVRHGKRARYVAHPDPTLATRLALDRAFAAKYGVTDFWFGALLRRAAIPIRLDPAA
jgi:hypothetical protein